MEISRRGISMPASPIRKLAPHADDAVKRGIKVYHLNIGQPDISTPPEFFEAVGNFTEPVLAYGPSGGIVQLRLAIVDYFASYGIGIDLDNVWITTGGSEAILFALWATTDPGDEVIVFEPFYTNYNGFAAVAGVKLVPIRLSVETGFRLPSHKEIERHITPKTKAILICTPNNPTGTVLTKEEMFVLGQIARNMNLYLISDEVYREFVYDGREHTSALTLPDIEDRVVVTDSISKRFSACGARIGFVVSRNRGLMQVMLKFAQARLCPPTVEQYGAVACFRNIHRFQKAMIGEYDLRRKVLVEELARLKGVLTANPEGAFYTVARLPVKDAERFATWLLTDFSRDGKTVMVAPAAGFYASQDAGLDEVRIAYVLVESALRDAIKLLGEALKEYKD
ncbi:pyridoxal phosphate-dependent aminotransferase [candidate division WOR-3 bacterium]|nr:pyridoxal phosphate-dependent aminotransferase [candidate division WOR-3 bacterium]